MALKLKRKKAPIQPAPKRSRKVVQAPVVPAPSKPTNDPAGDLGGRPSDYRDEYVDRVDAYIAYCHKHTGPEWRTHKVQGTRTVKGKKKKVTLERGFMWNGVMLPSIKGFAAYLNVSRATLYNWASTVPEFAAALQEVKEAERAMLIECGLNGYFNSRMALMMLNVNHGMVPKLQTENRNEHYIAAMFAVHERAEEISDDPAALPPGEQLP